MHGVNDMSLDTPVTGWAPQLRVGAFSVLLPLALGFGILAPWVWLGGFGIVIGIVVDVVAVLWWRGKQDAVFPKDVAPSSLLKLLVVTVVLGGVAFLSNVG
jgi:hypothetical protein